MSALKKFKDASSLGDFAKLLGYQTKFLAYLLYKMPTGDKYTKFEIPKKRGGAREINAPVDRIKTLQRRFANLLYSCCAEIDATNAKQRSLSHAFRRSHSIVTNARPHKNRRYVLNLDIKDFFPSFNFGRVRGFFLKGRDFKLNERIATIATQIACHENALPQGSPCSPIISDLLAHLLDVRLAQLAKIHKCTYSRYADDLTFSTNQKVFPSALASQMAGAPSAWILGEALVKEITRAGFAINDDKTRMQCRTGRQLVTGLTVNKKVNIRAEYYRSARAMCHALFTTGSYYRSEVTSTAEAAASGETPEKTAITTIDQLDGVLSHIHFVKDCADLRSSGDKKKAATAPRALYKRFLFFKHFVALDKPLIICEGKTDSVYLKCAIRSLPAFQPTLAKLDGETLNYNVRFFNHRGLAAII